MGLFNPDLFEAVIHRMNRQLDELESLLERTGLKALDH
jgi:hypothetical protein